MPFDPAKINPLEIDTLFPYQRLACLSYWLKEFDAKRLAINFSWDFSKVRNSCGTAGCALGLYNVMVERAIFSSHNIGSGVCEEFGLDIWSRSLFVNPCAYGRASFNSVTPLMVAEKIDQFLNDKNLEDNN